MHKERLKKVRRIEIRTSHIVDEMFRGQSHSAFQGRGIEFEEVRPYPSGDDVRTMFPDVPGAAPRAYVGEALRLTLRSARETAKIFPPNAPRP